MIYTITSFPGEFLPLYKLPFEASSAQHNGKQVKIIISPQSPRLFLVFNDICFILFFPYTPLAIGQKEIDQYAFEVN